MGTHSRRTRILCGFAAFVLFSGLLWTWPEVAHATSITVNTELDIAPDAAGNFPNDGLCSLRAAIRSAQNNSNASDVNCSTGLGGGVLDVIQISPSLTGKTLTLSAGTASGVQPFDLIYGTDNPLEIIGPTTNAGDFIIDGNNATRIFESGIISSGGGANSGVLTLANITVKGGNGHHNGGGYGIDGDGGAMYLGDGTHLTLDNVVLRDNTVTGSARGAAIYGIFPTITNNGGAYINNWANGNGGTGSGGGRGGAIFAEQGPITINGYAVLFDSNKAAYSGGAISTNPGGSPAFVHLERSLGTSNTATVGGVMFIDVAPSTLVFELADSTMYKNTASQGGGVFNSTTNAASYRYLRDTFVDNTGTGGLFTAGHGLIVNSIIQNSTCQNTTNVTFHVGHRNLFGGTNTGCNTSVLDSQGTITGLSPTLAQNGGPEVQKTFALDSTSNAIDNGSNAVDSDGVTHYCGTIDQRSVPRGIDANGAIDSPQPGDCDIGAYEYANYVVNWQTGTSSVLEGGSVGLQARLKIPDPANRPLAAPLTVPVVRDQSSTARSGIDYTVPANSVTFPAGSTDGSIVDFPITTLQDNVAERFGEFVKLQLGIAPGVAVAEPKQHNLSIQDDDQAGVIKADGGNGTSVAEATPTTGDSLDISLRSQPDYTQPDPNDSNSQGPPADVTVSIEPDRDCTVKVGANTGSVGSPVTMTILNADWQVPHTMSVFAVNDLYDEDLRNESTPHTCSIKFTFSSGDPVYNATVDSYDVNVTDNDVAGVSVTQSGGTTNVVEGGATDTYTLVLITPPNPSKPPFPVRGPTSVVVTPDAQCDVGNGAGVARSFSFTEANWNVAQTVTVTAVDDPTVELNHACAITDTTSGDDPVYNDLSSPPAFSGTPAGVTGSIKDYEPPTITNDPPRVDISTGGGVQVSEATSGTPDTLTAVLFRQPLTSDVTVNLAASSDPAIPGTQLLLQDNDPATPAAPSTTLALTFTPANWNVAQTVNVFAVNDDYDEPNTHSAHVTATIGSTAVGFNSTTLRRFRVDGGSEVVNTVDIPVSIVDNDTSGVLVTQSGASTDVAESGTTDTYTVHLATHPYNDVTVTVDPDPQCSVNGEAGAPQTLTILKDNWNVPQTVTVTAIDDQVAEGAHHCTITHAAASSDSLYQGLAGPSVVANITDNDPPRAVINTSGGVSVSEATPNTADTYTVVLASQPTANVTVNANVSDGQTLVSVGNTYSNSAALQFTPVNWNVARTVSLIAVNDAVDEASPHSGVIALSVTSTAAGYATSPEIQVDGTPAALVPVSIGDNDATITAGATPVKPGQPVDATWSGIDQPVAGDFIGLYPSSATANNAYLTFKPTTGIASGSVQLTMPSSALAGNTYELRLFAHNSYTRLATSAAFAVVPSVSGTPSPVSAGAKLTANWAGIASPTPGDFIGLYASSATANNAYLTFKPTTGTASGSVQLTVPSTAAPGSTYELRLFANNSYTRMATSPPFTVQAATLAETPSPVSAGTALTASWSGVAPATAGDFIGLYSSSAAANTAYLTFKPTTGAASGSVQLTVPSNAAGGSTYELRLFSNNTYSRLATSAPFTVRAVTESPSPVSAGAKLTANWAGIASPTPGDFIGLYPSSATANNAYLTFKPTTGTASGSVQITVPSGAAAGSTYELRLFANNSYTRLATSAPFTVQAATLTESPSPVSAGTALTASWSGVAPATAGDFIGLYPASSTANNAYVTFKPTTGTASGSVQITVPSGATPGSTYELRLFSNNTYSRMATSAPFTVQ